MRVLHTSDWHLGKRLFSRERLEEQRRVVGEIAELCEEEGVDLVLVAGDVFDTAVPPAEAEALFYEAMGKITAGKRKAVVISGNHDDALRLTAAKELCQRFGVYLFGGDQKGAEAPDWVEISAGGERVFVQALPYPGEGVLSGEEGESYTEKIANRLRRGYENRAAGVPSVLVAHLFALGGSAEGDERDVTLGGAKLADLSLFPDYDYIALGHIHKRQNLQKDGKAAYSGAILSYAFDETRQKSVTLFDLSPRGAENLRQIPLTAGKALVTLVAESVAEAEELLAAHEKDYVRLILRVKEPVSYAESRRLRLTYGCLVTIELELPGAANAARESRKTLSSRELFVKYYRSLYDCDPEESVLAYFLSKTEVEQ